MQTLTPALLAILLLIGAPAWAQTPLATALAEQLASLPAKTGLYLKHLKTGEEVAVRADESFNSQSVIKIPIMVRAFQLAEQGKLNLDERVTSTRAELRDGSGVFQFADLGLAPTLRDLIQQMIITSDNTATDVMTTRSAASTALNAWLAQSGYTMRHAQSRLGVSPQAAGAARSALGDITAEETTGLQYADGGQPAVRALPLAVYRRARDVARRRAGSGESPPTRRGYQRRLMVEDRNIWLGDITAREIGRMLEAIERETIASPASAATIRTFMRRQLAGSRRLPHFVDVPVAHKTGDAGNIANDVGIIYSRSGPIVIAVLVTGITGSLGEAEDRIGRLAEARRRSFRQGAIEARQPRTAAASAPGAPIQPPSYKPTPSPLTPAILVGDTLVSVGQHRRRSGHRPARERRLRARDAADHVERADRVEGGRHDAGRRRVGHRRISPTWPTSRASTRSIGSTSRQPRCQRGPPSRCKELARGARLELTMTAVRTR